MRLRFKNIDYVSKARDEAFLKCTPFFIEFPQEFNDNEFICYSTFKCLTDVLALSDDCITLQISSNNGANSVNNENLSFAKAHKEFISCIFPQKEKHSNIFSVQESDSKFLDDSRVSATLFKIEPPELELLQEQTFLSQEILQELGFTPLILTKEDSMSCLPQVVFDVINLDLCSFPQSVHKVLQDSSKNEDTMLVVKERKGLKNLMFERSSSIQHKSSRFLKSEMSLLQFEVYEVGFNKYDLQAVREPLFLLDPSVFSNQVEKQSTMLLDTPESMHLNTFDHFNTEHSLECISEELLNFSTISKGIASETEISSAIPINIKDILGATKDELDTATKVYMFEVPDILDENHKQIFEIFSDLMQSIHATFEESTISVRKSQSSFDELVVVPELTSTDAVFKSMPTPIFYDDKEESLALSVIKSLLSKYKQCSPSASDRLYLDWHQSKGGACHNSICSSILKKIEDQENCNLINFRVPSKKMVRNVLSTIEYFEQCQDSYPPNIVTELPESVCISDNPRVQNETDKNGKHKINNLHIDNSQQNMVQPSSKVSSLFNSMSAPSDFLYFLNAKRGSSARNGNVSAKEISDSKSILCPDTCKSARKENVPFSGNFQENVVHQHYVGITKSIQEILDSLQAKFDMILGMDNDLRRSVDNFENLNKLCILNSSQVHFMSLIKERASQTDSLESDTVLRGLVTMLALQKTSFHVCFYGVRVAHLYMKKLVHSIKILESSTQNSYSLLKDAYYKSEEGLIQDHPMISSVEQFAMSDFNPQSCHKLLLVAESKLFITLHKKITSMNLKLHEFAWTDKINNAWPDDGGKSQLNQAVLDALIHCDCLLVSHKYVTVTFPFDLFNMIIEYGDSHLSMQISDIIGRLAHKCKIHLIRVELKGRQIMPLSPEAVTNITDSTTEEGKTCCLYSVLEEDGLNHDWVERQSTNDLTMCKDALHISVRTGSETQGKVLEGNQCSNVPVSQAESPLRSASVELYSGHGIEPQLNEYPKMIIIANIREFDEEMIAFTRSSYQKILALEKEGLQVVEREYHLPVDLIFSNAICLVWFTTTKLRHYKSDSIECTLSTCIENVADSLLRSLSFSFQDCILIFEGEDAFLTEVMEASDDLYAAAVGLRIHLQCFLSGSSQTTDDIILNCINSIRKSREGAYPAMMESETLAEYFYTRFPSVNPFIAHAMLSCGDTVSEFLCLTDDSRIQSMKKFDMPERTTSLFSLHCKYGELGETKSCTTDCSSTLTSPLRADSSNTRAELNSEEQYTKMNIHLDDILGNDCLDTDTLVPSFEDYKETCINSFKLEPLKIPESSYKLNSKSFEWVDDQHCLTKNQHMVGLNWDCRLEDETGNSTSDLIDDLDPSSVWIKSGEDVYRDSVTMYKDLRNGSFDKSHNRISSRGFYNSLCSTEHPLLASLDMRKNTRFANTDRTDQVKRFQKNTQDLSSSTKFHCGLEPLNSSNECMLRSRSAGEVRKQPETKNAVGSISPEIDCWHDEASNWKQKSVRNTLGMARFAKQQKRYNNSTNSVHGNGSSLSHLPHELRGLRDPFHTVPNEYPSIHENNQAFKNPSHVSPYCPGFIPGQRILSPSNFDKYQYQGGKESRIACKRKWQNLLRYPKKSPSLKQQRNSASSSLQSWTPVDKRAKRTLTFVKRGTNKQSRLAWSDTNAERTKRRRFY